MPAAHVGLASINMLPECLPRMGRRSVPFLPSSFLSTDPCRKLWRVTISVYLQLGKPVFNVP